MELFLKIVKDTHRENTPSKKIQALKKYEYENLSNWYIKSTTCKRILYPNQIFKKTKTKKKVVSGKTPFF